ncbi:MAG: DUF4012 domain-containing protein, partial [Acidimicrobiales bacterium]
MIVGVLLLLGIIGTLHALSLKNRISGVTSTVQSALTLAKAGEVPAASAKLDAVAGTLKSANSTLHDSPDFYLLNLLPFGHQNVVAMRSSVTLALKLVNGGQRILKTAAPLIGPGGHLAIPFTNGYIPLGDLRSIQTSVAALLTQLPRSYQPPGGSLVVGPLRNAQTQLLAETKKVHTELAQVNEALGVIGDLAGENGDRRFLIAVANEAEMRGAGGMILSYGVLQVVNGQVKLAGFGEIDNLALKSPAPVSFPADFLKTWGADMPNEQWRNATIMSDFTLDAPVLESMYQKATGQTVDGVVQIDSTGLGAVLAGTGPLNVPGAGEVSQDNVVPLTMNEDYLDLTNRSQRHDFQALVAQATFKALTTRQVSLRAMGNAVVQAGKDRHILIYDNTPSVEADIKALGFDGGLPGPGRDFAQLTVQNFGGDKMDYYIDSALVISGKRTAGKPLPLTVNIGLANTAPPGQTNTTVFGPYQSSKNPPGEYEGVVTLYLPAGTTYLG